ncbi:DUF998 domain-containing protein [Catenuloplanes atrovinosus]|uniref:Membrane protein n=1 Tax=Catenuloplanes atrovinosus TaxID=137266 RepID=A0AAE4C9F7_9ACTN|nr:DUF998 domain-containing protein [Catenuloplanes atrovinosus]MDR7276013.1 putative membrane protein [Catenuloplanes atrovinosus]
MRAVTMMRAIFVCGAVCPLLLLAGLCWAGATRDDYDQMRHGVSQLTLGDGGMMIRLLFAICGALLLAAVLMTGRRPVSGPVWQWRLLGVVAVGLVVAGVFPTDPALGYPPGAPEAISAAGAAHQVGGTMLFVGTIAAAVVAARNARRHGRLRWATVCVVVAWAVTGLAVAAGVVFRLMQRDVIGTGPAGLLELLSMACGLCWVSAAMLRDRSSWAYADGR